MNDELDGKPGGFSKSIPTCMYVVCQNIVAVPIIMHTSQVVDTVNVTLLAR